jgi:hypothetical protein
MFLLEYVRLDEMHTGAHFYGLEKKVYENIPDTKCLGCPCAGGIDGKVVAECCRKASPPLYYVEFIRLYHHIEKTWTKDRRKELLYKCFEALINSKT